MLLSSKAQECRNLWKPFKCCHVGIHWKALAESYQMSTHLPRFQSFSIDQIIATSSTRLIVINLLFNITFNNNSYYLILQCIFGKWSYKNCFLVCIETINSACKESIHCAKSWTESWKCQMSINKPHLYLQRSKVLLTLPMLRLLMSKAQRCKDFWKPSKLCHVSIHWRAVTEYSQMSTHLPGFQPSLWSFASFSIGQISLQQHKSEPFGWWWLIWFIQNNEKKAEKKLKPGSWPLGTHLLVLRESFLRNTNMVGFRCFSKIVPRKKVVPASEGLTLPCLDISVLGLSRPMIPLKRTWESSKDSKIIWRRVVGLVLINIFFLQIIFKKSSWH